ncbi:MAG: LPS assembly protein LptD [Alphaproteobacteria bacterium]
MKPVLYLLIILMCSLSAHAKQRDPISTLSNVTHSDEKKKLKDQDVLVHADDVTYEDELSLVIARGNVQISDGEEVLRADTVTYNKKLNTVSASGNVRLYKQTGELITGNYAELSDAMKKGFIDKIYLVTPFEERFAADKGYKDDKIITMENAIYSPCELCKKDKHRSLTWQVRASKIIRDEESMDISYRNLVLDFKGVPVFYMPYFKHPDPSVERRSGILMPSFSNNSELGSTVIVPLYWTINPQNDITLQPTYMSKQGPLVSGEYRGLFTKGFINLSGSTTKTNDITGTPTTQKTNPSEQHGHFLGSTRFDLTDHWRFKGDMARVSTPTYFRKYFFIENGRYYGNSTLDSQGFFEGFYDKNYIAVGAYDFQNLSATVSNKTAPLIAPVVEMDLRSDTDSLGGTWHGGWDQNYITRTLGTKVGRVSTWGNYNLPYISSIGTSHLLEAEVRGDVYDIRNFQYAGSSDPAVKQTKGRVIPTLSLSNGYPLIQYFGKNSFVLEPTVKGVLAPNNMNNIKLPNEDSQDFEFDTTNLLKTDRFPGFDLVDGGQRVSYGVNFNFYNGKSDQLVKGFVGQSYSFSKERQFPQYSGVYKGKSDYVSSLGVMPHKYLTANWIARFDRKDLKVNKNLIQVVAGPPILTLNLDYVMIARQFVNNQYVERKQLTTALSSQFHEEWSTYLRVTKELGSYQPGDLEHGAGLKYQNDCFFTHLEAFRTFYQDRDLRPSKTVMLTLGFKNLGSYSTGRLNLNTIGQTIPDDPNAPTTAPVP